MRISDWSSDVCSSDLLAAMLGLSEHQVRVVAPFIGGGFGPKIRMFYPEEVLIPWLAIRLGRPIKWMSDRAEDFVSTTQERLQIQIGRASCRERVCQYV